MVLEFLRRVLRESDANILLVPHVLTPPGHYESDPEANDKVLAALRADPDPAVARRGRVSACGCAAVYEHPSEMKWLIARLDWFCGTRMHACIAGLSSGVPTAAIAYSLKTQGVFESCGVGDAVCDPRVRGRRGDRAALVIVDRARARSSPGWRSRQQKITSVPRSR